MSELALGTVQFGINYGITNESGQVPDEVVSQMLRLAQREGISLFDTASDYGASQLRLGEFAADGGDQRYVTKFSLPSDGSVPTANNLFLDSMATLRVSTLHAVLFHKISDFTDERAHDAVEVLRAARSNRIVARIGVSIYTEEDLALALDIFPDLDILQLPANLLDVRLLESVAVSELRQRGAEIHVRSVLLQGLLLSDPELLPEYFAGLQPALRHLHHRAAEENVSALTMALGAIRQHPSVDAVLVGATNVAELEAIIEAWKGSHRLGRFESHAVPEALLDPRNWPAVRVTS